MFNGHTTEFSGLELKNVKYTEGGNLPGASFTSYSVVHRVRRNSGTSLSVAVLSLGPILNTGKKY